MGYLAPNDIWSWLVEPPEGEWVYVVSLQSQCNAMLQSSLSPTRSDGRLTSLQDNPNLLFWPKLLIKPQRLLPFSSMGMVHVLVGSTGFEWNLFSSLSCTLFLEGSVRIFYFSLVYMIFDGFYSMCEWLDAHKGIHQGIQVTMRPCLGPLHGILSW